MTRTDVMASSRPHKDGAGLLGVSSTGMLRRLSVITAVLMLALALVLPSGALAATEPTSGYSQTPTTPAKSGTAPAKEASEPAKESSTAPATSSEPAKTLPFTGFDLRWSLAIGVLLIGAGFSIVMVQRRRSDS